MKKTLFLYVIFICSVGAASAQIIKPGRATVKKASPTVATQIADAEKSWISFWKDFTTAIKNRDTELLITLIARDYEGTYCENEPIDSRMRLLCQGWENIYKDFFNKVPYENRYALSKIDRNEFDNQVTVSRVWDSKNPEWGGYGFEYKSDGRWYLARFVHGCTA